MNKEYTVLLPDKDVPVVIYELMTDKLNIWYDNIEKSNIEKFLKLSRKQSNFYY